MIEPGPVKTQFGGNIDANKTGSMSSEAILNEGVDDLTQQLYKASFSVAMERMQKMVRLIYWSV